MSEFRLFGPAHVATLVTLALATVVLTLWVRREPKRIARLGPPLAAILVIAGVGFVAVDAIAAISRDLLTSLETSAPPKDRAAEATKAQARAARRFPK